MFVRTPMPTKKAGAASKDCRHQTTRNGASIQARSSPGLPDLMARSMPTGCGMGGGVRLPSHTAEYFSNRMGYDFSKVSVHTDVDAAAVAKSLGARAFTTGNHVVFGANQFAPGAQTGIRLLAHELTHVVQQAAGVVPQGSVGRAGDHFERQADSVAQTVACGDVETHELSSLVSTIGGRTTPSLALQLDASDAGGQAAESSWQPPLRDLSTEIRADIEADFQNSKPEDLAKTAAKWVRRARIVKNRVTDAGQQSEGLKIIAGVLARRGRWQQAAEVVSLFNMGTDKGQEGTAGTLTDLAAIASGVNAVTARGYMKALLQIAHVPLTDDPTDLKAWLERHTGEVAQAISNLEGSLGQDTAQTLSNSILSSAFVKDDSYNVSAARNGSIATLPTGAGGLLKADCDVYAAYGARLLRAEGWQIVGYFNCQNDGDPISHMIALARRSSGNSQQYAMVDSMQSGPNMIAYLGTIANDETAKRDVLLRRTGWDHYYFARPVRGSGIDPRLNTRAPATLAYP